MCTIIKIQLFHILGYPDATEDLQCVYKKSNGFWMNDACHLRKKYACERKPG